jgi:hypothetical protein
MLIRFGYELTFNCAEPTLMVCLLDAHRDHAPNIRFATPFETTPAIRQAPILTHLAIVFAALSRPRAI